MNSKKREKNEEYYNTDDLKTYMAFSAKEKLEHLEKMNAFFIKFMPSKNKKIWDKLKKTGW